MNAAPTEYTQGVPTAVVGGSFNFLAFLVSLQDIEQWLQISSLVVGNLVGILTVVKLLRGMRAKKAVDAPSSAK
jgi:hypothetical protein